MTIVSVVLHLDLRTVGDMGEITQAPPLFHIPDIDLSLHTLISLLPFSLALAVVGITESLMTATIVDEMTETKSDKNKEVRGQGIANVESGFFGGMAGCAMIGQTVINATSDLAIGQASPLRRDINEARKRGPLAGRGIRIEEHSRVSLAGP